MLGMIAATARLGETNGRTLGLSVPTPGPATAGASRGVVAEAPSPTSRVRSSDSTLSGLIDRATRGSETFRRLVTSIQASDGIVYLIEVLSEPAVTNGVTMYNFLRRTAPTDGNRFETTAAVNAGNAVIDELMSQRAAR
jgi:hypothetical protein